ncbi:MAG: META domain-containing protein [Bacteroidales bacterium]|nr:META domain-containing protein [Bacteroidales bacterium]
MKKNIIILFTISVFLFSCEKPEDLTNQIDITEFNWKVKSLTINTKKTNTPERNYFDNEIDDIEAYKLQFNSDTTLRIDMSINQISGSYIITSQGKIEISDIVVTFICCDTEFDEDLAIKLPTVTEYQVLDNNLILKGENCEIELEKQ